MQTSAAAAAKLIYWHWRVWLRHQFADYCDVLRSELYSLMVNPWERQWHIKVILLVFLWRLLWSIPTTNLLFRYAIKHKISENDIIYPTKLPDIEWISKNYLYYGLFLKYRNLVLHMLVYGRLKVDLLWVQVDRKITLNRHIESENTFEGIKSEEKWQCLNISEMFLT